MNILSLLSPRPAPVPEAGPGSSTTILGAPDIYFVARPGSLVNITCVVHSLKQPEHIFWYHDGQVTGDCPGCQCDGSRQLCAHVKCC